MLEKVENNQPTDEESNAIREPFDQSTSLAEQSSSGWFYFKSILAGLGVLIAGYVGGAAFSRYSEPNLDESLQLKGNEFDSNEPELGQAGALDQNHVALSTEQRAFEFDNALSGSASRHLLTLTADNQTLTIKNPVPDQQVEATAAYRYLLDGTQIFEGNLSVVGVRSLNNLLLPSWLSFQYRLLGSYDSAVGLAWDVVVQGNIAYITNDFLGILVLDITDPENLSLLGSYDTAGSAFGICVRGSVAYVADASAGLRVLNITEPQNLRSLGSHDTPGIAYKVDVQGDIAYVADDSFGLELLNITDYQNITMLGSFDSPGFARGVVVKDNVVYLADGNFGLHMVNVTDPKNPSLLATFNTPGQGLGIFVQGFTAYVADGSSGLQLVDVTDPQSPIWLGSYNRLLQAWSVFVQGGVAYVADSLAGLKVLDVTNPKNSTLLGTYDTPSSAFRVFLQGSKVFVVDQIAGLFIIDPRKGDLLGSPVVELSGETYPIALMAEGAAGAQANDIFKLTVNQLLRLRNPALVAKSLFPGETLQEIVDLAALFTDPGSGSFLTFSLNVPGYQSLPAGLELNFLPSLMATYDTPGVALGVFVDKDIVYVADNALGLQVIDVSNRRRPRLSGTVNTPGSAYGVVVSGNFAYVADYLSGLVVLNVTSPQNPAFFGSYNTPGNAYRVFLINNIAYVADGASGLVALNVTRPQNPSLLGSFNTPGGARDVFVKWPVAYVAGSNAGLHLLNVTNLKNVTLLGTYDTPGQAFGVVVEGNFAYVADNSALLVLNVSYPYNPSLLGRYNMPGIATHVVVQGEFAYVADDSSGLYIINITDPSSPMLFAQYDTIGSAKGVFVQGGIAYVADTSFGMQIIDLTKWRFKAAPTLADVGNYEVVITARDELGGTGSTSFVMRVEGKPYFNGTIPDQIISVGEPYNYYLSPQLIVDPNGDVLTLKAMLPDGGDLPSWLGFSGPAAAFGGVARTSGSVVVSLSVTDGIAGTSTISFRINATYKPSVGQPIIPPAAWREGKAFSYTIPEDAFQDLNKNTLMYTASLFNGEALPTWLRFDADTRTFSGMPPLGAEEDLVISIKAMDSLTGQSVSQRFVLPVRPNYAPEVVNPISIQRATVVELFVYGLSDETFKDTNGDPLNYTAAHLPPWLRFYPQTRIFEGKPSRSDTNAFGPRTFTVEVIASDGERFATTSFDIQVEGDSHWSLLLKIGTPLLSVFMGLLGAYLKRAVILNWIYRMRDEKFEETLKVGEFGQRFVLDCDPERIHTLQMKGEKEKRSQCQRLTYFFRSDRQRNPNGPLPPWLVYHPLTNSLEVIFPGPSPDGMGKLTLQAKTKRGGLLVEKIFRIEDSLTSESGLEARGLSTSRKTK